MYVCMCSERGKNGFGLGCLACQPYSVKIREKWSSRELSMTIVLKTKKTKRPKQTRTKSTAAVLIVEKYLEKAKSGKL